MGVALEVKLLIALNSAWNLLNFREGLIKALVADGHDVVLAAPADENVQALEDIGARFVSIPMSSHGINPLSDIFLLWRYVKLLQREKPDAMLNFTAKPNVYGSLAARFFNVPVINNIAGLGSVFIKDGWLSVVLSALYKVSLAQSHKVFFQNPDDLKFFLDRRLVEEKRTGLLPGSGVNLHKFKPVPLPYLICDDSQQPIASKKFTFLLIARMLKDKGIEEYVQAARMLKARYPGVVCALLGPLDGHNPTAISTRQMKSWVSEGAVSYWGTSKDVRLQLAQADCVVLPSYREGTPRTLLEAAAMARPLVATDVPGCRQAVLHGINGFLCEPKNALSLSQEMSAIMSLLDSSLMQMGNLGRQLIETHFDEQIVIDAYMKYLNDLMTTPFIKVQDKY